MRYLHTLWYAVSRSLTSPGYYRDILKAPFGFSLKLYLVFFILSGLITGVITTARLMPGLERFLTRLPEKIVELYPAELEIRVQEGEVSTNVPEPYYYPMGRLLQNLESFSDEVLGTSTDQLQYLLVIDTNATIEDFYDYQTAVLLTGRFLVYYNNRDNLETVSLQNIGDFTLNRAEIETAAALIRPYLAWVIPLTVAVIMVGTVWYVLLSTSLYLLFFSLITWVLGRLTGVSVTYAKAVQLGLHLILLPTLVLTVLKMAGIPITLPWFRTIIMTLLMAGILVTIREKPESQPVATST